MQARKLIDEFADAGVRLTAENGDLAFEGPRGVLTPERIEELRQHKAELLAALAPPDLDAFEERAAILEYDAGLQRHEAETLAAQEQGFANVPSLQGEMVRRWAAEIERVVKFPAVNSEDVEALKRAQAFISEGWALQAARLGWDEVELFGVCPCVTWQRRDRTGAAFGGSVKAVTAEAVTYVGGLRRYRAVVNNDGGAVPIWELAQDNPSNGDNAA